MHIDSLTYQEYESIIEDSTTVVLLPTGTVEPHGPHLSLDTDNALSREIAREAVPRLRDHDVTPLIAPELSYGVTECARSFPGALSIQPELVTRLVNQISTSFREDGIDSVCVINNHLEPEQDRAVREGAQRAGTGVTAASPLNPEYARRLSREFRDGECHAGSYETSLLLYLQDHLVREDMLDDLDNVPVSLSRHLEEGITDFKEMGLDRAYCGYPSRSSSSEGEELAEILVEMVVDQSLRTLNRRDQESAS